jgi:hypothetical protein
MKLRVLGEHGVLMMHSFNFRVFLSCMNVQLTTERPSMGDGSSSLNTKEFLLVLNSLTRALALSFASKLLKKRSYY